MKEKKSQEIDGKMGNWKKKGKNYYNEGQYEAALEMFNKILKNDPNNTAVLNKVGDIYFILNRLSEALSIYNNLCSIFKRLKVKDKERLILEKIGRIYCLQGEYSLAISKYLEALKIYDSLELADARPEEGKFLLLYTLGDLYKNQKNYGEALSIFTLLLELHSEFGPLEGIADDLSEIGTILYKQKNVSEGLKKFEEALQIYKVQRLVAKTAINLFEIGKIYYKLNQYSKALPYLQSAFEKFKDLETLDPDNFYYTKTKKMLEDIKNP